MDNSWGDVLLRFLRANDALSIEGSCEGYVAGEWEMKANPREGEVADCFLFPTLITDSLTEEVRSEFTVMLAKRDVSAGETVPADVLIALFIVDTESLGFSENLDALTIDGILTDRAVGNM